MADKAWLPMQERKELGHHHILNLFHCYVPLSLRDCTSAFTFGIYRHRKNSIVQISDSEMHHPKLGSPTFPNRICLDGHVRMCDYIKLAEAKLIWVRSMHATLCISSWGPWYKTEIKVLDKERNTEMGPISNNSAKLIERKSVRQSLFHI